MEDVNRYFIHPRAYWRVIDFIEKYCRYQDGFTADGLPIEGQKVRVHTWMKWQIRTIYGRYDRRTHRRAVREAYIEVPKKNGKSMYVSALSLYHLLADGYYTESGEWIAESSPSVYCAAATRDQAKIIHDLSKWIIEQDETLLSKARPMQYDIKLRDRAGQFKVLSSDAGGHEGIKSSFNAIDELHIHKDGGELYRTLKGAGAAKPQPLTIIITTAGVHDPTSIGWNRHLYAEKVMSDWTIDPAYHGVIYTAGNVEEEEIYEEETWRRANPSYGTSVKKEYFEDRVRELKNDPTMINAFKRYHLNIWTSSHSQWIPKTLMNENNKGTDQRKLNGKRCWIGMDLGATDDLTAVARLFEDNGQFYVLMDFFCTANKVDAIKNNSEHITYIQWVRNGLIDIAGENDTDHSFIEERLHEHIKNYKVRSITYDPYAAFELVQNLAKKYAGRGKHFLNPAKMSAKEISPPMKKVQSELRAANFELFNNSVLEWMFDNVMVKIDANDNIFPNKAKASGKIDGVVALILAMDGYLNDKHKDSGKLFMLMGDKEVKL